MIISILKTVLRNLFKNKWFTIINIAGLATGIGSILFISLYVISELSYDRHFTDSERIYRVALERTYPDRVRLLASSPAPLSTVLEEHLPDVEEATRLHRLFFQPELKVQVGDASFTERKFFFADSNFFRVFDHQFIEGDGRSALNDLGSVVITESTAQRYFGKKNAVGELIKLDTVALRVSGVIKDLPSTTHAHFDLLGSVDILPHIQFSLQTNNWNAFWVYSFIKIKQGALPASVEERVQELADRHGAGSLAAIYGSNYLKDGHRLRFFLQPLESIHLHSSLDAEAEPNSSAVYVNVLIGIAVIVLIISIINYVNLSTAKSVERAKEIGIRKTLGALARAIKLQIYAESFVICTFGLLLSIAILIPLWQPFTQLVGRSITISEIVRPEHFAAMFVFLCVLGFVAGLYPSITFSAVQPSRVLKGEYKAGRKSIRVRNGLMIAQFCITIAMITGSVAIFRQMNFLDKKGLGFSSDNVIVVKGGQQLGRNYEAFLNEIHRLPEFENCGGSNAVPGNFLGSTVYENVTNPESSDVRSNTIAVDYDFIETLQLSMVDGRTFSKNFTETSSVIINEAAVKAFGFTTPIGAKIKTLSNNPTNPELTVVGVVSDFHFYSLHSAITPLIMFKTGEGNAAPLVTVKANEPITARHIALISNIWKELTDAPFEYSTLKDDLSTLYISDHAASKTFNIFTALAIILSCVGLVGLTSYLAQQQLRDMSIRRVLGATSLNIFSVFSVPFIRMSVMAMVIAFPAAYFSINMWLETYAYREPMSLSTFAVSAVLTFVLLLFTLSSQFGRFLKMETIKLLKQN